MSLDSEREKRETRLGEREQGCTFHFMARLEREREISYHEFDPRLQFAGSVDRGSSITRMELKPSLSVCFSACRWCRTDLVFSRVELMRKEWIEGEGFI